VLPQSPRTRRRLGYLALALLVVLAAVVAQLAIGTSHGPPTLRTRAGAPQILREPKHVRATPADRAAAERTLTVFVPSAFVRRHLARSWPLATPHMRVGTSRADWLAGNLPVVPYPAAQYRTASFALKYSYRGVLGYDVLVLPKRVGGLQEVYSCELHDVRGRWLVDFCVPRKTL
jgi:hypothetical protein